MERNKGNGVSSFLAAALFLPLPFFSVAFNCQFFVCGNQTLLYLESFYKKLFFILINSKLALSLPTF